MSRILYTAFKGKKNSSFHLVNELRGERVFLTNSWEGVRRDIETIPCYFEKVIMFGLDTNLQDRIRFEQIAQKDGETIHTGFDFSIYTNRAKMMGIQYDVTETATNYLCNEAYFLMLKKASCPVLFVHIPSTSHMSRTFHSKLFELFDERE